MNNKKIYTKSRKTQKKNQIKIKNNKVKKNRSKTIKGGALFSSDRDCNKQLNIINFQISHLENYIQSLINKNDLDISLDSYKNGFNSDSIKKCSDILQSKTAYLDKLTELRDSLNYRPTN